MALASYYAITSAIIGAGTLHGRKQVRWEIVGEIVLSWVVTLPATILFSYVFAAALSVLTGSG